MSVSGFIFASFVLIRIIISYLDDSEDVVDPASEDVNVKKKLPVKYISNGVRLNESIRKHYYKVLDIHSSPIISTEVERYIPPESN